MGGASAKLCAVNRAAYRAILVLAALLGVPCVARAAWQIVPAPSTRSASSSLAGVSCSARGACTAVGRNEGGLIAVRLTAGTWLLESLPNPTGGPVSVTTPAPSAVDCLSATECMLVGNYANAPMNSATFAERWNGSDWIAEPTPGEDSDTTTTVGALSCTSAVFCLAVGNQTPGVGEPMSAVQEALSERWNGTRWVTQAAQPVSPAQAVGNAPYNELSAVACTSRSLCIAVGSASNVGGGPCRCGTLAERYTLKRGWALLRPSQADTPGSVSCPTSTMCMAVGGAGAQAWNGASWRFTQIPASNLDSVSCSSSRACVAVGTKKGGGIRAERWNGTSWSEQAVPEPAGGMSFSVTGVSCPTNSSCVLLGSYKTAGRRVALIERYT
jgi:hypothetical protein